MKPLATGKRIQNGFEFAVIIRKQSFKHAGHSQSGAGRTGNR
jgi:hypothetical protein